jgi:PAS domain S-box-containing protein
MLALENNKTRIEWFVIVLLFLSGCLLTTAIFLHLQKNRVEKEATNFYETIVDRFSIIELNILNKITVLNATVGFWLGSEFVTREEFKAFLSPLPGVLPHCIIGWAPFFPPDKGTKEKSASQEAENIGRLPILYAEDESAQNIIGFDLMTITAFATFLKESRWQSQEKLFVYQPFNNTPEQGIAKKDLMLAIFTAKKQKSSQQAVPDNRGVLFLLCDTYDLFGKVFDDIKNINVSVYATTDNEMLCIYSISRMLKKNRGGKEIRCSKKINCDNITIVLEANGKAASLTFLSAETLILPFGYILSAFLSLYISNLIKRRKYAETAYSSISTALLKSERRLMQLAEFSNEGVCELDADGKITYANKQVNLLLGYEPHEIAGKKLYEFTKFNTSSQLIQYIKAQSHLKGGRLFEEVFSRKDGKEIWVQISIMTLMDQSGKLLGFLAMLIDITSRKHFEKSLYDISKKFSTLLEVLPFAVIALNEEKKIVLWNRAAEQIFGWNEPLLLGKSLPFEDELNNLLKEEGSAITKKMEYKLSTRYGTKCNVKIWLPSRTSHTQKQFATLMVIEECTSEESITAASHRTDEELQRFFDCAMEPLCILNANYIFTKLNKAWQLTLGYAIDEMYGKNLLDFIHIEDRDKFIQSLTSDKNNHYFSFFITRMQDKDGYYHTMEWNVCLFNEQFYCAVRDISKHIQQEYELFQFKARYEELTGLCNQATYTFNPTTGRFNVSKSLEKLLGYDPSTYDATISQWLEWVDKEDREKINSALQNASRSKIGESYNIEYRLKHKMGHSIWVRDRGFVIQNKNSKQIETIGIIENITEARATTEKISALSARYQAILESVPDIIMEVNNNKRYIWANRAGYEFFGNDVIGRKASYYFVGKQDTYKQVSSVFQGTEDTVYLESWQKRKDGKARLLAWWCKVLKDKDSKIIGALSTARDITEKIVQEEELKAINKELAKKNEELTRFAYAISHDLKSPVVTVKAFSGFAIEDLNEKNFEKVVEDINFIKEAADKMNILLEELLQLAKIGMKSVHFEKVSLKELFNSALVMLAGKIREKSVEVKVPEQDFFVKCERTSIEEVILNILDNAIKFVKDQSVPVITVKYREREGGFLQISISDNGIGINPKYHQKIFELFEKINKKSAGSGIGLCLAKKIMEANNGTISVESEGENMGTTFHITLPLWQDAI